MNNCTKKGKIILLGQRKHEDKTPDTEAETHQLFKHRIFNGGNDQRMCGLGFMHLTFSVHHKSSTIIEKRPD